LSRLLSLDPPRIVCRYNGSKDAAIPKKTRETKRLRHESILARSKALSLWRTKSELWYPLAMEIRSCRVTIADMDGVAHTVEVTAATLFEAVALGLKQLQGNEWVAGIGRPMDTVTVSVKSIPVEHRVRIGEFTKWLERSGTSPAEVMRKRKVREILGLPARNS
jgi:hypothetical protein